MPEVIARFQMKRSASENNKYLLVRDVSLEKSRILRQMRCDRRVIQDIHQVSIMEEYYHNRGTCVIDFHNSTHVCADQPS